MAYSILTNTALANGSLHMWAFINLLLGNGWTKTKDSDASTYSNTGQYAVF
jgi:hypothetical protein